MLDELLKSFNAEDYPATTIKLIDQLEQGFLESYTEEPEQVKGIGACFIDALKTYISQGYVVKLNRPLEAKSICQTELFLLGRELIAQNPFTPYADALIEASIGLDCTLEFTAIDKKTVAVIRYNQDKENMSTLLTALEHTTTGITRITNPIETLSRRDFRTLCRSLHSFIRTHEGHTARYYHLRGAENLVAQLILEQSVSQEEANCYQQISKHFKLIPFEELHKLPRERLKHIKKRIREHAHVQRGGQRLRIAGTSELLTFINEKADTIFSRDDRPSLLMYFEEYMTGTTYSENIKEWLDYGSSYA